MSSPNFTFPFVFSVLIYTVFGAPYITSRKPLLEGPTVRMVQDVPADWPHPGYGNHPPPSPMEENCYTSWLSYYKSIRDPKTMSGSVLGLPQVSTSILVWETIQKFGPNSTYTACDGIPRLKFTASPTATSKSLITQTIWGDNRSVVVYHVTDILDKAPTCQTLNPLHCRKLMGVGEIGGGYERNLAIPADSMEQLLKLCPDLYTCDPILQEVVLIHWAENIVTRDIYVRHTEAVI
jgi:hypothetical protein